MRKFFKTAIGKTFGWVVGNWVFGLMPLLLMILVKKLSYNEGASEEVHHLLNDGLPLFVSCAIMGSIVIDFMNEGDPKDKWINFWQVTAPLLVFGLLLLVYLLIVVKVLSESYFSSNSWIYWFEIVFSVVYCSFAKYNFYK
jgi:hypothetical protein